METSRRNNRAELLTDHDWGLIHEAEGFVTSEYVEQLATKADTTAARLMLTGRAAQLEIDEYFERVKCEETMCNKAN